MNIVKTLALAVLASLLIPVVSYGAEQSTYQERGQAYLEQEAKKNNSHFSCILSRAALGLPFSLKNSAAFTRDVADRDDCSDFEVIKLLWLLYINDETRILSEQSKIDIEKAVWAFKYWPDEPGIDSMCYWSENHHITFAVCGYLAGQRYPEQVFYNSGRTGKEQRDRALQRIERWLELRFRTGFSEWNSNVYYNIDIQSLLALIAFAEDEALAQRASMVLDLLLADMVFNHFQSAFASTHGRAYEKNRKYTTHDSTRGTMWLISGLGEGRVGGNANAMMITNPRYRPPAIFEAIAQMDPPAEYLNRQRMGIRIDEAARWGLGFDSLEDGMVWLSLEAYAHPEIIDLTMRMFDEYNWWENEFFEPFNKKSDLIERMRGWGMLPWLAWKYEKDVCRNTREEVNFYTYRTPDYQLSTAQDYRKGYGGDQHHIWQATLGKNAVCFTTHPSEDKGKGNITPNYWTGEGVLPRVAQHKNVTLAIYHLTDLWGIYLDDSHDFTHVWLPKDNFDEVIEQDGWIFARKGDGYLGLYSQKPGYWQTDAGEDQNREYIVPGKFNFYICELGRKADWGDFQVFIDALSATNPKYRWGSLHYTSPSQGAMRFGWKGDFMVDGEKVSLRNYPRYANPFSDAPFGEGRFRFEYDRHWLELDWEINRRTADSFLSIATD